MLRGCDNCVSTGWVCEAHPRRAFGGPEACLCGAAGMPCPVCNYPDSQDSLPDTSRALKLITDSDDGY